MIPSLALTFILSMLPISLANIQGSITLHFPPSTSWTEDTSHIDSMIPTYGGQRTISFNDNRTEQEFYWSGPSWSSGVGSAFTERPSWEQECKVWVDEGYNDFFVLDLGFGELGGLKDGTDGKGYVKCTLRACNIPEKDGGCTGKYAVPQVDVAF